ncbi:MAG: site-specific integrase, partial [Candidatus Methylumidiphilus sp.]
MATPKPSDADRELIRAFQDSLWVEEGLSENTQKSYASDLALFADWLDKNRQKNLSEVEGGDIEGYLAVKYR